MILTKLITPKDAAQELEFKKPATANEIKFLTLTILFSFQASLIRNCYCYIFYV